MSRISCLYKLCIQQSQILLTQIIRITLHRKLLYARHIPSLSNSTIYPPQLLNRQQRRRTTTKIDSTQRVIIEKIKITIHLRNQCINKLLSKRQISPRHKIAINTLLRTKRNMNIKSSHNNRKVTNKITHHKKKVAPNKEQPYIHNNNNFQIGKTSISHPLSRITHSSFMVTIIILSNFI